MIKDKLLVKCPFIHTMEQLKTVDGREIFKLKIGHMRADYANGRWYNTIWPCHDELCTLEIAREIDRVYEELISSQCFSDLMALKQFCYSHPEAAVGEQDQDEYNFYLVGQHCDFWLRLITRNNDYNLYLSAFAKAPDKESEGASL